MIPFVAQRARRRVTGPPPEPPDAQSQIIMHYEGGFSNSVVGGPTITNSAVSGYPDISSAQKKFGASSGFYNSTGYQTLGTLNINSGDFTFEMWVYPTSWTGTLESFFCNAPGHLYISSLVVNSGTLSVYMSQTGSSYDFTTTTSLTIPLNQWSHVALIRSGTTFYVAANGVSQSVGTMSGTIYNSYAWTLGAAHGSYPFRGHMDDVHVTKQAKYTTPTYTVPSGPWSP